MRVASFLLLCIVLMFSSAAWALTAKDLPAEEAKARKGDVGSQVAVGDYYHARSRFVKAFEFYRLAAKKGHYDARNAVANMYETGEGTKKNILKAYIIRRKMKIKYTNLYPEPGAEELREKRLKNLASQLTPEQLAEAEKRIQQDWDF